MKSIDLTNKCDSCWNFKPVPGTARGDCLANPYGDDIAHDPDHPYWQVARSRTKCAKYRARTKPQTNADRIRAMSDEELAVILLEDGGGFGCLGCEVGGDNADRCDSECVKHCAEWLRQPVKDGDNDVD